MRRRLVLLVFFLTSCGQPLVTTAPGATRLAGQTTPRAVRPTPAPTTSGAIAGPPGATLAPSAVEATAVPATPALPPTPSPTPAVVVVPQTPSALTNELRWRAQQIDRHVFDPRRIYVARSPTPLLWFDPLTEQTLEIGRLLGDFTVQAEFVLRDGQRPALEVPYRINQDFGLTAISEAVRQRMLAAGYTESVESYVVQSDAVQPK